MISDNGVLFILVATLVTLGVHNYYVSLSPMNQVLIPILVLIICLLGLTWFFLYFSKWGRENNKRLTKIKEIPLQLLMASPEAVHMGQDLDLDVPIYLPDSIRSRHVHILGATGSGKTESVVLNFLRQDVSRGLGAIILDAKGDLSFLKSLKTIVPDDRLQVFDLGSEKSMSYDPLGAGSPMESAQRLFSSLTWSEEYYKSKALSALQRIFQLHFKAHNKNPKLKDLNYYLEDPEIYSSFLESEKYPKNIAERDFSELSGLRDQIRSLCIGHLEKILSPSDLSTTDQKSMDLLDARDGKVLYFRLQSLMSPQTVVILGRLLINHLNFLAGTVHRGTSGGDGQAKEAKLVPTYLDEFASFACPEFADLISKARSANLALHFSHQSIGDLTEVSKGFLNRITDNSATKIVMRINDPDSADFMARSFGTRAAVKLTQSVLNAKDMDLVEYKGTGSLRQTNEFRAPPDTLKSLPTGVGAVLVAHGHDTRHGASSVFKVKFPLSRVIKDLGGRE